MEEMGLNYQVISLSFPPRVYEKGFKELNPMGTVPVMEDPNEEGVRMTESTAICHYLATKYGSNSRWPDCLVSPSEKDFASFLDWTYRSDATLTFPQTLYLRYAVHEERKQLRVAADYEKWFLARARFLETTLSDREYLCSDRFTVADIAVGYALMLAQDNEVDVFTPNISAYWDRLKARPAFLRVCEDGKEEWGDFPRTRGDVGAVPGNE